MLVGIQMHPVDGAAAGDGVGVKERTPGVLANLPNRICEAARSDIPPANFEPICPRGLSSCGGATRKIAGTGIPS